MTPLNTRWKEGLIITGGTAITLLLLNSVMAGNWTFLLLSLGIIAFISLVVLSNFPAYLAFGALSPIGISLPFAQQIPPLALMLAVCSITVATKATVQSTPIRRIASSNTLITFFYVCLIVRYCMDPVLPGYAIGIGDDITGFRSWLDHLIGLTCVLATGSLITSLADMHRLFRWLLVFAILFASVALAIMFIPSLALTRMLSSMGIAASEFSNGWRRFLFLPTMGQFMIAGCLLPGLFNVPRTKRFALLILGTAAVIAGGNRGSALALLVMIGTIWTIKRKPAAVVALIACSLGLILLANVIVTQGWGRTLTPWTRVMSAFSPTLSRDIGATGTIEWRIARWQRAAEDIRAHPWLGLGYGGIRGYFRMMSDITDLSPDLQLERDVATGLTHNGYVSAARALGIPVTMLFILIMAARIRSHIHQVKRHRNHDVAFFEGHIFLCAYFVMMLFTLMFGAEIRHPTLWLFLALSLILERLKPDIDADRTRGITGDAKVPSRLDAWQTAQPS